MIDLNSGLETGIVITGLAAMLCLGLWLFFRQEQGGGKSLFLNMIDPFDEEIDAPSSLPQVLPSSLGETSRNLPQAHKESMATLNPSMRLRPFDHPNSRPKKNFQEHAAS